MVETWSHTATDWEPTEGTDTGNISTGVGGTRQFNHHHRASGRVDRVVADEDCWATLQNFGANLVFLTFGWIKVNPMHVTSQDGLTH